MAHVLLALVLLLLGQAVLLAQVASPAAVREFASTRQWPEAVAALRAAVAAVADDDQRDEWTGVCMAVAGAARRGSAFAVALDAAECALALQRGIHGEADHADVAECLNVVAFCREHVGRSVDALPLHEQALAMRRRLHGADHADVAQSLNNVAYCLESLGRAAEALPRFEAAIAMHRRLLDGGDDAELAASFNNAAHCLLSLGRPEAALPQHEAALAMYRRLLPDRDDRQVAWSEANVGHCLQQLGRVGEALPRFEVALAMLQRLYGARDHADVARALDNLAGCLSDLGRTAAGLPKHEVALAIRTRLHAGRDHPDLARSANNVAGALQRLGRAGEALPLLEMALAMQRRLHGGADHPDMALALANHAVALGRVGRTAAALPLLEQALAMRQRILAGDHPLVANSLDAVGCCLRVLGRPAEALAASEQALAMRRRLHGDADHPAMAQALDHLAWCRLDLGRLDDALAGFDAALAMLRRLHGDDDPAAVALVLDHAAACLESMGRTAMARDRAQQAAAAIERLRELAKMLSGGLQQSLFDELKQSGSFERLQRLEAALGNAAAALHAAERSRGRELLDLLQQAGEQCAGVADERRDRLAGPIAQATADVNRHENRLAAAGAATPELVEAARAARTRLRQLLDERAALLADVRRAGAVRSPADVRAALGDGEVLLVFTIDPQGSLVHVVPAAGEPEAVLLPDAARAVATELPAVLRACGREPRDDVRAVAPTGVPGRDPEPATGAAAVAASSALFGALVPPPLWQRLVACRRVFVAAHRGLHRLPFEALVVGVGAGGPRYWLDDGPPIAYVPSGSVLCWLRERASSGPVATDLDLLAIGDPGAPRSTRVPEHGALLLRVDAGGEGARAGLQANDVLLRYDGQDLADEEALHKIASAVAAAAAAGQRAAAAVPVLVWRAGEVVPLTVAPGRLGIDVALGRARAAAEAGPGSAANVAVAERQGDGERLARLPPLRGARAEVAAIAATFVAAGSRPERVGTLLGADATEPAVFARAATARYLHFACHGLAEEFDGQSLSLLVLHQGTESSPGADGLLKLDDLLQGWPLRLRGNRLVVLSACRTQVGATHRDEAPYALPFGFLVAGARAVVSSLWAVDDASTAELMADFYRRLLAGDGGEQLAAFTAARKALRAAHPDPFHWGAFVYVGVPQ